MQLIDKLRKGNHIAKVQGKDFVLFSGLLELAHDNGLELLETELLSVDLSASTAVFRATAKGARGAFTGHGDAMPGNLSKMILPSFLRMAETRAICRALRFYLGIGMCARDELPGDIPVNTAVRSRANQVGNQKKEPWDRNTEKREPIGPEAGATDRQINYIEYLRKTKKITTEALTERIEKRFPLLKPFWTESGAFGIEGGITNADADLIIKGIA